MVNRGSMTVFFSLVFLLIFALVGSMIEITRGKVNQGHSNRTIKMATESLMTEYNRPLFQEYNLFFLEDAGKPFEQSISEYAAGTMNAGGSGYVDMFDGILSQVEVTEKCYAGDNKAFYFAKEISDYMKRRLAKDALVKFLKKTKDVTKGKDVSEKLEEKMSSEEEGSNLDRDMQKLMKYVDGVQAKDGKVTCENSFCKKYITEKKAQTLGINNSSVWEKVKEKAVLQEEIFHKWGSRKREWKSQIRDLIDLTKKAIKTLGKMQKDYANTKKESADLKDYYARMNQCLSKSGWEKVLNSNLKILQNTLNEDDVEKVRQLWKDYDTSTINFDYHGVEEKGGLENPRKGLSGLMKKGILGLVVEKPDKISKKKIQNPDNYSKLYSSNNEESHEEKAVSSFVDDEKVKFSKVLKNVGSYAMDAFCMDQYIDLYCGKWKKPCGKMKKCLDYEQEYIIGGKSSDEANLKSVVNRILLVRSLANLATILASSDYRQQAYNTALAVVGFTGMEPLIRFTQSVIIITWAMEESLVDIAALLKGYTVPIIKTKKQIQVKLTELVSMGHDHIQKKAAHWKGEKIRGISYSGYLTVFSLCMEKALKRYRLMDIMELNLQKNHCKTFSFGTCIYSMKVQGGFTYRSKYFQLPLVQEMLNRKIYQTQNCGRVECHY